LLHRFVHAFELKGLCHHHPSYFHCGTDVDEWETYHEESHQLLQHQNLWQILKLITHIAKNTIHTTII